MIDANHCALIEGVGSSEYLGCFVDAIYEDRDLPMALLNDAPGGMNYEHCIHHCFTQVTRNKPVLIWQCLLL